MPETFSQIQAKKKIIDLLNSFFDPNYSDDPKYQLPPGKIPVKISALSLDSTYEKIKEAYKKVVLYNHPDKTRDLSEEVRASRAASFEEITEALEEYRKALSENQTQPVSQFRSAFPFNSSSFFQQTSNPPQTEISEKEEALRNFQQAIASENDLESTFEKLNTLSKMTAAEKESFILVTLCNACRLGKFQSVKFILGKNNFPLSSSATLIQAFEFLCLNNPDIEVIDLFMGLLSRKKVTINEINFSQIIYLKKDSFLHFIEKYVPDDSQRQKMMNILVSDVILRDKQEIHDKLIALFNKLDKTDQLIIKFYENLGDKKNLNALDSIFKSEKLSFIKAFCVFVSEKCFSAALDVLAKNHPHSKLKENRGKISFKEIHKLIPSLSDSEKKETILFSIEINAKNVIFELLNNKDIKEKWIKNSPFLLCELGKKTRFLKDISEICKKMIEAGVLCNKQDDFGKMPIHYFADHRFDSQKDREKRFIEILKFFEETLDPDGKKLDPCHVRDSKGNTIFHYLAKNNQRVLIEKVLENFNISFKKVNEQKNHDKKSPFDLIRDNKIRSYLLRKVQEEANRAEEQEWSMRAEDSSPTKYQKTEQTQTQNESKQEMPWEQMPLNQRNVFGK